jgi:hypothetical protein
VLTQERGQRGPKVFGNQIERLHADAGYRGHNAPPDYKFKV